MGNTFRKNVIVVGAGASKEFELPTGAELKNDIAKISDIRFDDFGSKLISGDYRLVETLRRLALSKNPLNRNISEYLHVAWRIRDNMPLAPSIDNFLDTHRHDSKLIEFGKIAIAKAIIEAEANSRLHVKTDTASPRLDLESVQYTWLAQFFSILVAQRNFPDFIEALKSITFVSFNYDRCLHQFFTFAARDYFNLDNEKVSEVLQSLKILYPYGSVGDFKWQSGLTNFGQVGSDVALLDCAKGIQTFTEGSGTEVVDQISEAFSHAEIVIFMGFGFLKLNMKMLFGDRTFSGVRVLATGKGMSQTSRSIVVSELEKIFPNFGDIPNSGWRKSNVDVLDETCASLIFEFQRFLAD